MRSIFLSLIPRVYYSNYYLIEKRISLYARVHFEHVQVIRCDIKPGSVERSIDLGCILAAEEEAIILFSATQ
jgi:hypothetical protein